MAEQKQTFRFRNVAPDERVWAFVVPAAGEPDQVIRTWTDDGSLTVTLPATPPAAGDATTVPGVLLAFTRGRQPLWYPISTTPPGGESDLTFQPELELTVMFWILAGNFERQRLRALNSLLIANAILFEQNTGLRITIDEIVDATSMAPENPLLCGSAIDKGSDWSNIEEIITQINAIGSKLTPARSFRPHVINVFLTDRIRDKGYNGKRAVGDNELRFNAAIALDLYALDDLLLHELGHLLGLPDVKKDDIPHGALQIGDRSPRNVMRQFSKFRNYFTEGQIAKMHCSAESAVSGIYGFLRPPGMTEWFAHVDSKSLKLIARGSMLCEDRSYDMFPEAGSSLAEASPVVLAAQTDLKEIESLEELVTASRERYRYRARQLGREARRCLDDADTFLLWQTSIEEYVAGDMIRRLEYLRITAMEAEIFKAINAMKKIQPPGENQTPGEAAGTSGEAVVGAVATTPNGTTA